MKNNSPTEAGQTNLRQSKGSTQAKAKVNNGTPQIDAINQVFALFKLNYHNQFYKAFSNNTELNSVKRLWLETLGRFSPEELLRGAKSVIEQSEYLPTLKTMIQHCDAQNNSGLPDVHSAYIEACSAPSPKVQHRWRHPAVYYAGKTCDWYFLQSNSEYIAFPIFKREYELICQKVVAGLELKMPIPEQIEEKPLPPLSKEENSRHLKSLRKSLKL